MICPICKGELFLRGFHFLLTCHFCNGSGEVSDEVTEWRRKGEILKNKRIAKRLTLRKASQLLRRTATSLSDMEIGKVAPDMTITYDRLQTIKS